VKIHHAIALALVGWYLIMPNRLPNSTEHDVHAPLSQWTKIDNYATREQCESAKALSIQMINHPTNLGPDAAAKARKNSLQEELEALCITHLAWQRREVQSLPKSS
jgi:hypothetical protein